MFLPRHCVVCRQSGSALCPPCAAQLVPAPRVHLPGLDHTVSLFSYEGCGRTVITRLKFDNHRDALVPLSTMLAAAVGDDAPDTVPDLVTWVPTTPRRRRHRGYDQAQLIAAVVGPTLDVPCVATLRRSTPSSQAGRGRAERLTVEFSSRPGGPGPRAASAIRGATVVVVDDVRTTGASLVAAARALRSAGAGHVVGATLAATPGTAWRSGIHPLQSG